MEELPKTYHCCLSRPITCCLKLGICTHWKSHIVVINFDFDVLLYKHASRASENHQSWSQYWEKSWNFCPNQATGLQPKSMETLGTPTLGSHQHERYWELCKQWGHSRHWVTDNTNMLGTLQAVGAQHNTVERIVSVQGEETAVGMVSIRQRGPLDDWKMPNAKCYVTWSQQSAPSLSNILAAVTT